MNSPRMIRTSTLLAAVALTALALTACSNNQKASTETTTTAAPTSTASGDAALSGKTFTATEVTGHTLVDGSDLTIAFEGETIAVQAGCNNMHGGYTFDESTLEAPMLASTMMACEPELMDQDTWASAFLAAAPEADLAGDTLTLKSGDTTIVLTQD